jgi:STE24 endopeptidase
MRRVASFLCGAGNDILGRGMISLNIYLIAYICIYLASFGLYLAIDRLNLKYLNTYGHQVPSAFDGIIDEKELKKISRYTSENIYFKLVHTSFSKVLFLFIILSGVLPWFAALLSEVNFLLAGLVFFGVLGLGASMAALPFDYYHSFVLEDKYGFNTKTLKTWLFDIIKSLFVTLVLGTFILSALLLMLRYAGGTWWIWAWLAMLCFQILITILYPTVIAPLFNTFAPIENSDLKGRIELLAKEQGIKVEGIYQMDATKRTRHTNAYFSGLGKAKRIVLFDSLIDSHNQDEILAILAHEIGHLKKNHIKKQLVIMSLASLLLFFLASKLITSRILYESFGFLSIASYVGIFLVSLLWAPIGAFLSPIGMAISRRFEKEADDYSIRILKTAKPLATALKKMAKDNLSNLRPHPLYVCFNYSHPPLLERVEYLEASDFNKEP